MPYYPPASGTPGGSNTQVQFNDGGAFGGDAGLTYAKSTDALTVNGALTVDTNTLVVDAANNRVGVGVATPGSVFDLETSQDTDDIFHGTKYFDSGAGPAFIFRKARGSAGTPTAVQSGDSLGAIVYRGRTSAGAFSGTVARAPNVLAAEGFTSSAQGTKIAFDTTPIGSTTAATRLTVENDGVITIAQGQIAFPATQVASSGANTLDDYEEGSWTPVIGGSGGTSGQTYTLQEGTYIKIGKLVMLQFQAALSAKGTITNNVEIQGFPFTSNSPTGRDANAQLFWNGLATNWVNVTLSVNQGGTSGLVRGCTAAATTNGTSLVTADIGALGTFAGTIVYIASA